MKKLTRLVLTALTLIFIMLTLSLSSLAAELRAPVIKKAQVSCDSITLTWEKVKKAEGYKVYIRKKGEEKFTSLGSTKKLSLTAKKLKAATEYEIRVRAYTLKENKKKDFGEYSRIIKRKTKLEDIKGLSFRSCTVSSISVKWQRVKGADSYKIFYAPVGSNDYKTAGSTKKLYYRIKGLNGKTKWKIKVMAVSDSNKSAAAGPLRLCTTPKQTKKPEIKKSSKDKITLKWEKTGLADYYIIYAASSAEGKYKKLGETEDREFTYICHPETTRYFKVKPVIENELQTRKGVSSPYKKVTSEKLTVSGPEEIFLGDYPEYTLSHSDGSIKWSSSDRDIIDIKSNRPYAKSEGTATLTVTYRKKYKAKIKVKVKEPLISTMSAVYDLTNEELLYAYKINDRCYPASITKLITALVCLKYMKEDDIITVGNELNLVEPLSSRCDLKSGDRFYLRDILYGLLLPSGGDAAYTLAVNCARKVAKDPDMYYVTAKNYFVGLMNDYMDDLGATGTNCKNPHGYPVDGHYSTVHDLLLVAQEVLNNKTLSIITSTPYRYVTSLNGRGFSWGSTNSLIRSYAYYYHPNAHGMKTGTVDDNYTGIISVATKDDRTLITVVIGCKSYNARYDATHKMLNTYL